MKKFCKAFAAMFAVCFVLSCFVGCDDPNTPPVSVTGITIDKNTADIEKGKTLTLTATITPDNADNKNVSWSSSSESVVVKADGLKAEVTVSESAKDGDKATVTVKTDDGGFTASCEINVNVKEDEQTPENDDNKQEDDEKQDDDTDKPPVDNDEQEDETGTDDEEDPEKTVIEATANDVAEKIKALEASPDGTYTIKVTGKLTDTEAIKEALTELFENKNSVFVELDLTKITGFASVGENAFLRCNNLTGITLPSTVKSIGDRAFYGCKKLETVKIPSKVTSIGERAFSNCESLKFIVDSDNPNYKASDDGTMLLSKDGKTLYCDPSAKEDFSIPTGITTIGDNSFYQCNLTSVTIPNSVTNIGKDAFCGCKTLTSVTLPDSITTIGEEAFYNCENLESVTIPDTVTEIKESTFDGCKKLVKVTLSNSLTSIGDKAFNGCKSLANVTLPEGLISIGAGAFYNCESITDITIPSSIKEIGKITVTDTGTNLGLLPFYGCSSLESLTVKANVGNHWFYMLSYVKTITICEGVETIDDYGFGKCKKLENLILPRSLRDIGENAFEWCESLKSLKIPGDTEIGKTAFVSGNLEDGVTILAETPQKLGSWAFPGNGTKIYVPKDSLNEYKNNVSWKSYLNLQAIPEE